MIKGMTGSRILTVVYALACSLVLPATAGAQSAFAGVVKDATGGWLPGVTVEASRPSLIEAVRSASIDANVVSPGATISPAHTRLTVSPSGRVTVDTAF